MKRVDFIFGENGKDVLVQESSDGRFILSEHIYQKQSDDTDLSLEQKEDGQ